MSRSTSTPIPGSCGTAIFLAKSGDMEAYLVGRVVNSPKHDGERCIESVA